MTGNLPSYRVVDATSAWLQDAPDCASSVVLTPDTRLHYVRTISFGDNCLELQWDYHEFIIGSGENSGRLVRIEDMASVHRHRGDSSQTLLGPPMSILPESPLRADWVWRRVNLGMFI